MGSPRPEGAAVSSRRREPTVQAPRQTYPCQPEGGFAALRLTSDVLGRADGPWAHAHGY